MHLLLYKQIFTKLPEARTFRHLQQWYIHLPTKLQDK